MTKKEREALKSKITKLKAEYIKRFDELSVQESNSITAEIKKLEKELKSSGAKSNEIQEKQSL